MASKLFIHSDSDEDSIKTDYTTEDDADALYDIETILAHHEDNLYLVKWQGYPLPEATWEPRDGLPEDNSEIWEHWRKRQRAVEQGEEPPFDLDAWARLRQQHRAVKDERRARRNEKRRKKNLPTRPDTIEEEEEAALLAELTDADADVQDEAEQAEESEDEPPRARSVRVRPPAQQEAPRKGVAQRLKRARATQRDHVSSSDESSEDSSASSSGDSLLDELDSIKNRKLSPVRLTRRAKMEAVRKLSHATSVDPKAKPRRSAGAAAQYGYNDRKSKQQPPAPAQHEVPRSGMARKSAPSNIAAGAPPARAKKSSNVMANWAAEKQKRKRVIAPVPTSGDAANPPRFATLSIQNAFQKYSRTEAAPDITALNVVDPRTGKISIASKGNSSATSTAQAIAAETAAGNIATTRSSITDDHNKGPAMGRGSNSATTQRSMTTSAYARRSPPPDTRREDALPQRPADDSSSILHSSNLPERRPSSMTETKGDETRMIGRLATTLRLPPKDWPYRPNLLCCFFFRAHGKCKQGHNCKFAHNDTGFDAPPPGVTIEDARASQAAYLRRFESGAESTSTVAPAPLPAAGQARPEPIYEPMSRDPQKVRVPPATSSVYPPKLTCHFWRIHNSCTKGDNCQYAHWDTGLDAAPPGSLRKKSKSVVEPVADYRRMTNSIQQLFGEQAVGGMSPGQLTASPMHIGSTETVQLSHAASSLRSTSDASTGLVTMYGSLKLYTQGNERPYNVRVKFEVLGGRTFTRLLGEGPTLRVEKAILISDFLDILWKDINQSLDVVAGSMHLDIANEHDVSGLAELSKLHSCGLLATVEGYSADVLMYPSNDGRWKFMEAPNLLSNGDALFKFCIFNGYPELRSRIRLIDLPTRPDTRPSAMIVGAELAQLDYDRILTIDVEAVFLMIPPAHAMEMEVYRQAFAATNRTVYHAATPGAWAYFRRKHSRSGVVLIHPDVPLSQVPGLHEASLTSTKFFTIGVDRKTALLEGGEAAFRCTRILTQGTAVFLTDDLIVYHPDQATKVIQNFLDANSLKPEGGENHKLVARPGLKKFLLENFIQRDRPDERWLRLYGAICDLCPPGDEDGEDPPNPLPTAHLVSIAPELLPSFAGLWERDETAATDMMVEWFAGWAELHASRFRRFIVCHQPKAASPSMATASTDANAKPEMDPRHWAQKFQHLGVLSPGKVREKVLRAAKPRDHVRNWLSSK